MEDVSKCGGGSNMVERSGGDMKNLVERDEGVEIVDHGGDFVGVGIVFDFEKDDVLDDLVRRRGGRQGGGSGEERKF
ncbi:unnamed protein product [Arabis nemorensis]|uniref:Uncharacterized protein n=1 Tax=Arabis nemorensis TaxID=586526 RepID=A0A565CVU4_9BRAS|nr:unnamed protein product [Arabis nemorensis]